MLATVRAIEYYLPEKTLTNADLAARFPEWGVDKIAKKTGIVNRHVVSESECSSDLAVRAAEKLFAKGDCRPADVDFVLLCTQTPDYLLPTSACLVQHRLGLPPRPAR